MIRNFETLFFLLVVSFSLLHPLVNGLDLFVDSSFTSQIGDTYPTLNEAAQAIYNPSTKTLYENNNTITLRSNTLGTIQSLPNFVLTQANQGGISIIFENAPSEFVTEADCDLLPTLELSTSSSSAITHTGLDYFFLQGLNIYIYSDKAIRFITVRNVTFDRFCLQPKVLSAWPSPPSWNDSEWWNQTILFQKITNFTLSNFLLKSMSPSQIAIDSCWTTYFENWRLLNSIEIGPPIFAVTNNAKLSNQNFSVIKYWDVGSPDYLDRRRHWEFTSVANLYFEDVEIAGHTFYEELDDKRRLFNIKTTQNITMRSVTMKNILASPVIYVIIMYFDAPKYLLLENFYFTNTLVTGPNVDDGFDFLYVLRGSSPTIIWRNFTFENITLTGREGFASIFPAVEVTDQSVQLENFVIRNSTVNTGGVINIKPPTWDTRQQITKVLPYYITNLTIIDNTFESTTILAFLNGPTDPTGYTIDMYRVEFSNVVIANNTFTSTGELNIVEVIGSQVRFLNFTMENNSISKCSFIKTALRVSSLFFINSTIKNLSLTNGAVFLDYSTQQTQYLYLEEAFFGTYTILTEERPFMLVSNTFSDIKLASKSSLIVSNNPTVIMINNTFDDIISDTSKMISIGKYKPPITKPPGSSYAISTAVQDEIFVELQELKVLFQSLRTSISAYEFSDPVAFHFVYFENNSFSSVSSNEDTSFLSISNLQLETTIVGLFSCSFTNITISSINAFNLLSFSEVYQIILKNTSFVDITGGNYILAISTVVIYKLQLDATRFESIQDISGYNFRFSICYDMKILEDQCLNIQTRKTWIYLYCGYSEGSLDFQSLDYTNATITLNSQEMLSLYFLEIQIEQVARIDTSQNVVFNGAKFSNILTDKSQQGFVQHVYRSPTILLTLSNSAVSIMNSQFYNLSSLPDDNIIGISAVNITITNCSVSNLRFNEISGAIYLIFSNLVIESSTFQDNSRPDDGIGELLNLVSPDVDSIQNILLEATTFKTNVASLIIVQGSKINFEMKDCLLENNYPQSSGSIFMTKIRDSSVTFQNVTFHYSQGAENENFDYIYDFLQVTDVESPINVTFESCTLEIYKSLFKGDLMVLENKQKINLNITKLTYHNMSTSQELLSYGILRADNNINAVLDQIEVEELLLSKNPLISLSCSQSSPTVGEVRVTSSTFKLLKMSSSSSIFYVSTDSNQKDTCTLTISLSQVNFSNIISSDAGPIFQILTSKLISANSSSDSNVMKVSECNFQSIKSSRGAVYYGKHLQNSATLSFEMSTFSDIHVTDKGAVFYFEENTDSSGTDSTTSSRLLTQSGANSEYFVVTSSNFSNITAHSGGVYYSQYSNDGASHITFNDNIFENVSVEERGAILYVNDPNVSAVGNQFINTSALIAGSVIYSQEANFDFSTFSSSNTFTSQSESISLSPNFLEVEVTPAYPITNVTGSSFSLTNFTSHSLKNIKFKFTLKYVDAQISQDVYDESNLTSLEIRFGIPAIGNKKTIFNCTGHGSCTLPSFDFELAGDAYDIIEVNATYQSYQAPFYYSLRQFYIQLRECLPGEINKTISKTCYLCGNGEYSLNTTDKDCSPCPPGVTCDGGAAITLSPGYWRNSSTSPSIVPCNDSGVRCLGGDSKNCSEGFTGPVCMQCDTEAGYLSNGPLSCSQCPPSSQVISLGIFLFLGLLAYQLFVVYSTYKFNQKLHELSQGDTGAIDRTGAYMVILATYSQVNSVISKLSAGYINELFGVSSAVGNPSEKIFFSLGCLFSIINTDPLAILKFKTMYFVLSPAGKVLIASLLLVIRGIHKRKEEPFWQTLKMRTGVAAVVFIILEQPGIIGALCEYLTCTLLDPFVPAEYVAVQAGVECGTSDYDSFKNAFVIPALIAWGFAIPLFLLVLLYKNKKNLSSSEQLRIMFGGLYSNYKEETYYWGIVIIIFKISIFTLDSLINIEKVGKAMILLLFMHPYYILFKNKRPHQFEDLQRAEKYVILSFIWTLIAVLIKEQYDQYFLSKICELGIVVANGIAVGYLLYKIFFVYLQKVAAIFMKIKAWWTSRKQKKSKKIEMKTSPASARPVNVVTAEQM